MLDEVRFGFPQRADFLGPVDCRIGAGQCWAIVGPNGAGKSTLLRLMAGLYKPTSGEIRVCGTSIARLSGRLRAQRVAFVPQHPPSDLDTSARDVVLMGRFPHRSLGLFESVADYEIAERAMKLTATLEFADRPLATLSGGEAQRVHIASAIAQEARILLLDEPTASLDIQHQLSIFRILTDRAHHEGLAVVVVTHDVNLAAQFCSHVLLLHEGRVVASGAPREVITPDVLNPVYGVRLVTLRPPNESGPVWVVPVLDRKTSPAAGPAVLLAGDTPRKRGPYTPTEHQGPC